MTPLQLHVCGSLIAGREACERRVPGTNLVVPYPDPVHGWAVPTVGYGVVCARDAGPYTLEQCRAMLFAKIETEYGRAVLEASPSLAQPVNLWRLAAAVSFCWNLGPTNYRASGMRKAIDRGDWPAAAANCRLWCMAGGRKIAGLVARREIEARMLLTDYAGDEGRSV